MSIEEEDDTVLQSIEQEDVRVDDTTFITGTGPATGAFNSFDNSRSPFQKTKKPSIIPIEDDIINILQLDLDDPK